MMRWPPRSLFARILVFQGVLALAYSLLFGLLFYAERSRTISELVAEKWAPALRQELAWPAAQLPAPLGLVRRQELPEAAMEVPAIGPRLAGLKQALEAQGFGVQAMALSTDGGTSRLWLRLADVAGPPWVGIPGDPVMPQLPLRLMGALLIGTILLAGASLLFARRLMNPLRQLEQAMRSQSPEAEPPQQPVLDAEAPQELQAIDRVWRELLARYQQHERERALLLAGVSHDLRAPLTRIRMAADLLPEAAAERRESIARNVQVADRLLESFLDYARAQQLPLDQRCDLAALARRVVLRMERPEDELSLHTPPSLCLEGANELLLDRVLTNLISNALQHGQPPVRVALQEGPQNASLEVWDAGAGMSPAAFEHACQAFARGDASRGKPGTGLGLSVVVHTLRRMGAEVSTSQIAQGFCVRLQWHRSN
jgi:two-component system osmolarity sensor histidine kinase EnvZ